MQDLEFLDACLATLAHEANIENFSPVCDPPIQGQKIKHQDKEMPTYHWNDRDVLFDAHHPIDGYHITKEN